MLRMLRALQKNNEKKRAIEFLEKLTQDPSLSISLELLILFFQDQTRFAKEPFSQSSLLKFATSIDGANKDYPLIRGLLAAFKEEPKHYSVKDKIDLLVTVFCVMAAVQYAYSHKKEIKNFLTTVGQFAQSILPEQEKEFIFSENHRL